MTSPDLPETVEHVRETHRKHGRPGMKKVTRITTFGEETIYLEEKNDGSEDRDR